MTRNSCVTVSIRHSLFAISCTVLAVALVAATALLAADVEAFLGGATRSCLECSLAGRDVADRDLKRARLDRADLRNANLAGVDLFGANLHVADLRGANLEGANLTNAILSDARIEGAKFDAAIMPKWPPQRVSIEYLSVWRGPACYRYE